MCMPDEPGEKADMTIAISLSGGGYRAAVFAAGALLAISDSTFATRIASISSVSGGSISSAFSIGGFSHSDESADAMGRRARLIAGLAESQAIPLERYLEKKRLALGLYFTINAVGLVLINPGLLDFLFFRPTMLSVAWTYLAVVLPLALVSRAIFASYTTVQRSVEGVATRLLGRTDSSPPELTDLTPTETDGVRRVFCATDLDLSEPVFLTHDLVIRSASSCGPPRILASDAVAASARFPGFRPLSFTASELGWTDCSATSARAKGRPFFRNRAWFAVPAFAGLGVAVAAPVARLRGTSWAAGWTGLPAMVIVGVIALLWAWLWARGLGSSDIQLVDGGTYDNLGTAFALVANDPRFPSLPTVLGTKHGESESTPTVALIVDASRRTTSAETMKTRDRRRRGGLGHLIPLQLRALPRSASRHGNVSNSDARKQAIQELLRIRTDLKGRLISIQDLPASHDEVDWVAVVEGNATTKTTLDALPVVRVQFLLLHGYRLMEGALESLGGSSVRHRSMEDIFALGDPGRDSEFTQVFEAARGPYARRDLWIRRVSNSMVLVLAILCAGYVVYDLLTVYAFNWRWV